MQKSVQLTEIIHKLLYKTEALSALVVQNDGNVSNFARVASTLVDDPAMLNVLIAPGGIVSEVYPFRGNEAVLGFDFFSKEHGNKEALLARKTGKLVFGGPFTSVQGGQVLVGRLPVYLPIAGGNERFWGLVSVTLLYPQVLDGLGLNLLEKQGYAFELWRISPDTGKQQIIANSAYAYNKDARFIEKAMNILGAEWHFRLSPVRMWYQYPETWTVVVVGLFVCCLVAFVVQNNHELKRMQILLEKVARTDLLTGIANRRSFLEAAPALLQQSFRNSRQAFVIIFDLDHFKALNDTHGHATGDAALEGVADRIKRIVRPYDLFARYGGEEFILLVPDVERDAVMLLAERMRLAIGESPFVCEGTACSVTASFGLARVLPRESLEAAIARADEALYTAKREGRNRCVCAPAKTLAHDEKEA